MSVVCGEAAPRRRAGIHKPYEILEVLFSRTLPDHDVHPPEELLLCLCVRRGFMVALDARVDVGVEIRSGEERCVAVDDLKEAHLLREIWISGKNTGDVHHLGKPNDPLPPPEPCQVVGRKHGTAGIKRSCRDAGWEHDQDIERCSQGFGEHFWIPGIPQTLAIPWGSAITVVVPCEDEPGILCRHKKRTLDMDMGVDQPGHHVGAVEVVLLLPMVVPEADDVAVLHREIHALPGTCEGVEDHAAGEDSIRRLKPPCRRKSHPVQGATSRSRMTDALAHCRQIWSGRSA